MKKSVRLSFSLLLLIAAFTALTCRSALQRGFGSFSFPQPKLDAVSNLDNSTILSLASIDFSAPFLKSEVETLIEGNFPMSIRHRARMISSSSWRRENHGSDLNSRVRSDDRIVLLRRTPKNYHILPELRQTLRHWIRNRRLQPSVMLELPSLVKRQLDPSESSRLYNSCAVVGNSGILLKNDHGELIDSHDFVIRLNNARTTGYARHVGSKTNLSFVNSNILNLCARRQNCFCHPYGESVPIIMYICQPVHFVDYATCNSSHKAPLLITDSRFDVLCASIVKYYSIRRFVEEKGKVPEEWGKVHDEKVFHYSSGMQAVLLAAGICERVSVFGFGKSGEAKHHYHTNQKAELDLHDYEAEYAFYRDLVEKPQVIPFISDTGFNAPPVVFYH